MKACRQCRVEKPKDAFYVHPAARDGRMATCKECHKANVSANYRANVEHYRRYDQDRAMLPKRVVARSVYQKTPQGKAAVRRAHIHSDARFPLRRAARVAAGNAIRDGRLVPRPCEVCGEIKVDAHHDDYSQPLSVRWLCRKHHREHHKQERAA